jgi:hypothetical protein
MTEHQAPYSVWPAVDTESNAPLTPSAAAQALLDEIERDWIDQRITEVLLNDGKIWPEEVERIRRDVTALMAPYRARVIEILK